VHLDFIHVRRFRSILDQKMDFSPVTVLVGPNGTGKSSFLHALELFYSTSPKVEFQDFYNRDVSEEMALAVTFNNLSPDALDVFGSYLQQGKLTVERVFVVKDGKITHKYYGSSLQNKEFESVRIGLSVKDRGKTAREAYEALKANPAYASLPSWSNLQQVAGALKSWEAANPAECTRTRDDGQFFGFEEVAQGYLGRFTKFLFVPAVRQASDDASEGKNSVFSLLMDLVVRSVLAKRDDLRLLRVSTQTQYEQSGVAVRCAESNCRYVKVVHGTAGKVLSEHFVKGLHLCLCSVAKIDRDKFKVGGLDEMLQPRVRSRVNECLLRISYVVINRCHWKPPNSRRLL